MVVIRQIFRFDELVLCMLPVKGDFSCPVRQLPGERMDRPLRLKFFVLKAKGLSSSQNEYVVIRELGLFHYLPFCGSLRTSIRGIDRSRADCPFATAA